MAEIDDLRARVIKLEAALRRFLAFRVGKKNKKKGDPVDMTAEPSYGDRVFTPDDTTEESLLNDALNS